MKKTLLLFILLFALPGHSFEIRSMMASTPCVNNGDTTIRDCWAQGVHRYGRTTYQCCLIRTLGTAIDSLNNALNEKRSTYRNYEDARKNLEMSEDIIIREKKYLATLYFTPGELFKGYILYAPFRPIGDDGVRGDLEDLDQFMESKYGKPQAKKSNVVLPDQSGMAFEYATWNQQRCTIKLAIVSDGRQIWAQESVLNRKFDESRHGSSN